MKTMAGRKRDDTLGREAILKLADALEALMGGVEASTDTTAYATAKGLLAEARKTADKIDRTVSYKSPFEVEETS